MHSLLIFFFYTCLNDESSPLNARLIITFQRGYWTFTDRVPKVPSLTSAPIDKKKRTSQFQRRMSFDNIILEKVDISIVRKFIMDLQKPSF